jgi:glycerophosphoryl diester phosphodiesterase
MEPLYVRPQSNGRAIMPQRAKSFWKLWAAAIAAATVTAAGTGVASTRLSERAARESMAPTGAPVIAVGHRGTRKFAPENTIAAFEKAIAIGARAVEMDVRTTKDGEFVVMHDARVDRTTDGSGRVADMTLAEVRSLDAGSWFGPAFAGEKVPTLREALRALKGRAAIDIDFKDGPDDSAARIAAILDEEGFNDGSLVTVFVRAWHYKRMKPLPPRYVLRPHFRSAELTAAAREEGIRIMGLRRRNFTFAAARAIADNDLLLFSNVMGHEDNSLGFDDSLRAGARFIQTDRLDLLVPYLKERGLLVECAPTRDLRCLEAPRVAPVTLAETSTGASRYETVHERESAATLDGGVSRLARAGGASGAP